MGCAVSVALPPLLSGSHCRVHAVLLGTAHRGVLETVGWRGVRASGHAGLHAPAAQEHAQQEVLLEPVGMVHGGLDGFHEPSGEHEHGPARRDAFSYPLTTTGRATCNRWRGRERIRLSRRFLNIKRHANWAVVASHDVGVDFGLLNVRF